MRYRNFALTFNSLNYLHIHSFSHFNDNKENDRKVLTGTYDKHTQNLFGLYTHILPYRTYHLLIVLKTYSLDEPYIFYWCCLIYFLFTHFYFNNFISISKHIFSKIVIYNFLLLILFILNIFFLDFIKIKLLIQSLMKTLLKV